MRWLMDRLVPDEALRLRATLPDRLQAFKWAWQVQEIALGRRMVTPLRQAWQRLAFDLYDMIGEV